jgi:hypothetical protein
MKLPVAFAVNLALQIAAWVWFSFPFPRIKHYLSWCMNASTGLKVTPKEKWR